MIALRFRTITPPFGILRERSGCLKRLQYGAEKVWVCCPESATTQASSESQFATRALKPRPSAQRNVAGSQSRCTGRRFDDRKPSPLQRVCPETSPKPNVSVTRPLLTARCQRRLQDQGQDSSALGVTVERLILEAEQREYTAVEGCQLRPAATRTGVENHLNIKPTARAAACCPSGDIGCQSIIQSGAAQRRCVKRCRSTSGNAGPQGIAALGL